MASCMDHEFFYFFVIIRDLKSSIYHLQMSLIPKVFIRDLVSYAYLT